MIYHNSIRHPNSFSTKSGKTILSTNEISINNCLKLLFTTSKGELLGDPEFGCNLMELIYQPNDIILQDILSEEIIETIDKYEPRITVNKSLISYNIDVNTVYINIKYYINNTGSYGDFSISVNRE